GWPPLALWLRRRGAKGFSSAFVIRRPPARRLPSACVTLHSGPSMSRCRHVLLQRRPSESSLNVSELLSWLAGCAAADVARNAAMKPGGGSGRQPLLLTRLK